MLFKIDAADGRGEYESSGVFEAANEMEAVWKAAAQLPCGSPEEQWVPTPQTQGYWPPDTAKLMLHIKGTFDSLEDEAEYDGTLFLHVYPLVLNEMAPTNNTNDLD